jgi:vesicle coat complex subunit
VRKSISVIGRCAIKIPSSSDRCVKVLIELLELGSNHAVQEIVVVMKDIFRKFPSKYEGVIPTLCEKLDSLDESESKSALIWIIGEYGHHIDNSASLLEYFLETFKEELPSVQLQLITATVKLFLKKPSNAQGMVQKVLERATQQNDNPDIRDRAFLYWRLLSSSPEEANVLLTNIAYCVGRETSN